ncbi:hypothetical protein [Bacillus changyiensis]|uniref:hypothetical protein n=1 Tax=Bacillus changyiensis TaxID=3004103 RepID=UPI0022E4AC02|nr:hypothetical protein [Bacillus changyiensis]MDA1478419.1 hypothetical protein [Bacillus changyiensis]
MELSDDDRCFNLLIYDKGLSELDKGLRDFDKGNLIKAYIITNFELPDSTYQDVLYFVDDLLGMKHNCSHFTDTLFVKEEFDFDFPFDMLAIRNYVQEILSLLGIDKKLPDFKETAFNYLSQD